MGRPKFDYDSEGTTFVHFLFIIHGFCLLTFFVYYIISLVKEKKRISSAIAQCCMCQYCSKKIYVIQKKERSLLSRKSTWLLVAGLAFFVLIGWFVWESRNSFPVGYDPYAVLGISSTSTDSEIRKAYKKLTLIHHPDKVPYDMKQQAEAKFIEINTAYKVLTDEETRRLFDETGNADGIRNMTVGIALPAWMVSQSNIFWMLAAYGLVFGILLPYTIGRWWNVSKLFTKNKIRFTTMSLFYKELRENTTLMKGLSEIICRATEFKEDTPLLKELGEEDEKVLLDRLSSSTIFNFGDSESAYLQGLSEKIKNPVSRRVLLLTLCHLYRISIPDSFLKAQQFVIEKSFHLVSGLFQIATSRSWVILAMNIVTFGQMLIQAVHDPTLGLLQIPGFTPESIKSIRQKRPSIKTPWDLKEMTENEIQVLEDEFHLSLSGLSIALSRYPRITLIKPHFKVMEHSDIPVGSLVTAFFFIAVSLTPEEERQAKKLSLLSDLECESKLAMLLSKETHSEYTSLPAVHAPSFPGIKLPAWWALLSQAKTNVLQCSPVRVTSIPMIGELVKKPNVILEPSLVMQFNAPSQPGSFALYLELKCDSYLNTDFHCDIKLNVVPVVQPRPGRTLNGSYEDEFDSD